MSDGVGVCAEIVHGPMDASRKNRENLGKHFMAMAVTVTKLRDRQPRPQPEIVAAEHKALTAKGAKKCRRERKETLRLWL